MIVIEGQLYSTKNHKRILHNRKTGKPFIGKSAASLSVEAPLLLQLQSKRRDWSRMIDGKEDPLRIQFKLYRKTRARFDYVNLVQGILDLMTKAGWIQDDNADMVIPCFLPYEVDPLRPRTEISIL